MKKYLQITIVVTIFGILVLFKQFSGKDDQPVVGIKTDQNTPIPTILPTSTPVATTPIPTGIAKTSIPTIAPTIAPTPAPQGKYKNGTFTGSVEDAFYGNIQVQAVISGGMITDVVFLQYPSDNRTSQSINSQAMPMLRQEAIAAQSAQVDGISGASSTSPAFIASLTNALSQAKN